MANYAVVDIDKLNADLKKAADAIRAKDPTITVGIPFPGIDSSILSMVDAQNIMERIANGAGESGSAFVVDGYSARIFHHLKLNNINTKIVRNSAFAHIDTMYDLEALNVKEIAEGGFYHCPNMSYANIPSIVTMGESAFANCYQLKKIDLGNSLQNIGRTCFYGTQIKHLTLPETLTTVGPYAFANNSFLESVTFKAPARYANGTNTPAFDEAGFVEANLGIQFSEGVFGSGALKEINLGWPAPSTQAALAAEAQYFISKGAPSTVTINYNCNLFPSKTQLADGFEYDYSQPYNESNLGGTRVQVKNVTNSTAKNAMLAYGYSSEDYIIATPNSGGNAVPMSGGVFTDVGKKYLITWKYYNASNASQGQHLIALNGTAGNLTISSHCFYKIGKVAKRSTFWTVGQGEGALIWYDMPPELYLMEMSVVLDTIHYSRTGATTLTAANLNSGYTYNLQSYFPDNKFNAWVKTSDILGSTVPAGFSTQCMHLITDMINFQDSIKGIFTTGSNYKLTLRAYTLDKNAEYGELLLLRIDSNGTQHDAAIAPTITKIDDNLYDLTYTFTATGSTYSLVMYSLNVPECLIGNITIKKV